MITTRITAGAFFTYKDKVLLMKRGLHKKLGPGFWAGIGGHMELGDITNPRELSLIETCYREVFEETGISKSDIKNLKLRYIAIRKDDTEVRLHYHFMGEVETELPLPECEEGELHWVHKSDILDLQMTASVKEAVRHWLASGKKAAAEGEFYGAKVTDNPLSDEVYAVVVNKTGDMATITEL